MTAEIVERFEHDARLRDAFAELWMGLLLRCTRVLLPLSLVACASGKLTYTPPAPRQGAAQTVTINRSRADVWRALIPELGKTFFVINNLDQSSGFVNVSYSGDPERFVDCGHIVSSVRDTRGERNYDFPAARADQRYEVAAGDRLYTVARSMALEGRINIILEEISTTSTRVTVNTRYVLTKHMAYLVADGPSSDIESVTFGFAEIGSFPGGTTCQSTGALERELLRVLPRGAVESGPGRGR